MGESRYTKVPVNEITEITQGYKFAIDNPGAPTMEMVDPQALLTYKIKSVDIGEWDMFVNPLKTVSLAAYEGKIAGFLGTTIISDDDWIYDGSALWDAFIMDGQNDSSTLNGALDEAFGASISPAMMGRVSSDGTTVSVYSAYAEGITASCVKDGDKTYTVTFNTPFGVTPQNSILLVNIDQAVSNQEIQDYRVIDNGFVVEMLSASYAFKFALYYQTAATLGGKALNVHGAHTHGKGNLIIRSNTNLFNLNVITRINVAGTIAQLTHNYHGQVATGSDIFGGITKSMNSQALAQFRGREGGANRGYIHLLLKYL